MALEQRITNEAQGDSLLTDWYRKRVTFDRTIARLERIASGEFMLKGALALHYRFGAGTRTTLDMDFAARSTTRMRESMNALCDTSLDDFFSIRVVREPTRPLVQERAVEAYRWSIEARLDEKFFERIVVDVGIGDPLLEAVQRIRTQPILAFADIPATEISVIPIEQHIAEKLHAYVQDRGTRENTRVKDIVDLALFARMSLNLAPTSLRAVIEKTFAAHGTPVPSDLPPPPASWALRYPDVAHAVDVPATADGAWREARELLRSALALPHERVPDGAGANRKDY